MLLRRTGAGGALRSQLRSQLFGGVKRDQGQRREKPAGALGELGTTGTSSPKPAIAHSGRPERVTAPRGKVSCCAPGRYHATDNVDNHSLPFQRVQARKHKYSSSCSFFFFKKKPRGIEHNGLEQSSTSETNLGKNDISLLRRSQENSFLFA